MVRRRTILQVLVSVAAWGAFGRKSAAAPIFDDAFIPKLTALAAAVLPDATGTDGRARAVNQFMAWVRDYRAGAELDHGYGITWLRRTPPSPALRYPAQLDDLDRRAGGAFAGAALKDQQRAVADAVDAARIQELPARPDGGHIATDFMALFFNGPEANDLAYGRRIGRFGCRGLTGSDERPAALPRGPDRPS